MASTGTRERWQSKRPFIRCRFPVPQLPVHTAIAPVSLRFGAGREGGDLFVADVQPLELTLLADGVCQPVQAIPDDAIDPFHARGGEGLGELFSDRGHAVLLCA